MSADHYVKPGDRIQFGWNPPALAPIGLANFLVSRGWNRFSNTIGEDRWKHFSKAADDFTWEQAMAYEFYEFITLGGK